MKSAPQQISKNITHPILPGLGETPPNLKSRFFLEIYHPKIAPEAQKIAFYRNFIFLGGNWTIFISKVGFLIGNGENTHKAWNSCYFYTIKMMSFGW